MKQRKELQKVLTEKNLKKTSQRALVWAALLESKGHPSVEEIRDSLIAKGHRIGLATIYRTIKILLESGMPGAKRWVLCVPAAGRRKNVPRLKAVDWYT